jgi:hypothetical protein
MNILIQLFHIKYFVSVIIHTISTNPLSSLELQLCMLLSIIYGLVISENK